MLANEYRLGNYGLTSSAGAADGAAAAGAAATGAAISWIFRRVFIKRQVSNFHLDRNRTYFQQ